MGCDHGRVGMAEEFDTGYVSHGRTGRHAVFTETLGLPAEVEPNSFVTPEVFGRIADELRVGAGDLLVDLACGRGGPGLLLSRMTGADLVGVDFSAVAVEHAAARAALFVPAGRATHRVGDLAATGLDAGCADAVVCIDSIQFAPDPDDAVREAHRVLRPGGRYVLTNWQPDDPEHPDVPARFRRLRFAELLGRAGFIDVVVEDRPDLAERVAQVFRAALETAPTDDEALHQLCDEARRVRTWPDTIRRVLVTATAGTPPRYGSG